MSRRPVLPFRSSLPSRRQLPFPFKTRFGETARMSFAAVATAAVTAVTVSGAVAGPVGTVRAPARAEAAIGGALASPRAHLMVYRLNGLTLTRPASHPVAPTGPGHAGPSRTVRMLGPGNQAVPAAPVAVVRGDRNAAWKSSGASRTLPPALRRAPRPAPRPAGPPNLCHASPLHSWICRAEQVMIQHGTPRTDVSTRAAFIVVLHESGGNPHAYDRWDSNAAAGTPSEGIAQVTGPTFNMFALPGYDNIWNPVDNMVAAFRYAIARYGSMNNIPGVVSVRGGGTYVGY